MGAIFSSCDSEPVATGSDELQFGVSEVTRASATDASNITVSPFIVFGDMHPTSSPSFLTSILDGTVVSHVDGSWVYSGTQYWFPDHEHSFVAVHPASVITGGNYQYSDSRLSFSYDYPQDFRQAADILVATHRRIYEEKPKKKTYPVSFRFHHLLSRIQPEVKILDPSILKCQVVITGITFKDYSSSATYNVTPAPLVGNSIQTDDGGSDQGWVITGTSDLKFSFPEEGPGLLNKVIPDNAFHKILADDDALLLLPKSTPTVMEMTYKVYEPSESNPDVYNLIDEQTVSQTIPTGFQAGMSYTLSLTMIRGQIQFKVEIREWGAGSTTDATVPRK